MIFIFFSSIINFDSQRQLLPQSITIDLVSSEKMIIYKTVIFITFAIFQLNSTGEPNFAIKNFRIVS